MNDDDKNDDLEADGGEFGDEFAKLAGEKDAEAGFGNAGAAADDDHDGSKAAHAEADAEADKQEEDKRQASAPAAADQYDPPSADGGKAGDGDEVDWQSAPENLRRAFEKHLEHVTKSDRGRISSLQRQTRDLTDQLNNARPVPVSGGEGGEDGSDGTPPDPMQTLEALAEDYPELAGPMIAAQKAMKAELDQIKARDADVEIQRSLDEQNRLLETHPDFFKVLETEGDEFNAWLNGDAPARFQPMVAANKAKITDAAAAAEVMDAFLSRGTPNQNPTPGKGVDTNPMRQRQRRAATAAPGQSQTPSRHEPDLGDFDSEFDKLAAKKDKEMAGARA